MTQPPAPALSVRNAVASDITHIAAFASQLYALHHAWDPGRFWDLGGDDPARRAGRERFFTTQLTEPDTVLLVAEQAEVAVGYAYLTFEAYDYEHLFERAAWLHDLFVLPEARGGGAARKLFAETRARSAAAGCPVLALNVAEVNTRGQTFFARQGARITMREMVVELSPLPLPPST